MNVTRNSNGGWDAKREVPIGPVRTTIAQADAYDAARGYAINLGGGEVRIHGVDGRIRNSNTIGKPDPFPRVTGSTT